MWESNPPHHGPKPRMQPLHQSPRYKKRRGDGIVKVSRSIRSNSNSAPRRFFVICLSVFSCGYSPTNDLRAPTEKKARQALRCPTTRRRPLAGSGGIRTHVYGLKGEVSVSIAPSALKSALENFLSGGMPYLRAVRVGYSPTEQQESNL